MSNPALFGMLILNLVAASGFLKQHNYGMALVFTSYAIACAGFIWSNWR
jgi:hypothetical protein